MLWTRGPGVQENWDLWLNASVFAYNTTVSSSTGVTPHYAMFGRVVTLPLDWVSYILCREENAVPLDWGHDGRETTSLQEYERRQKSETEHSDVQALDTEYQSWMFSLVFQSENHPCDQS